MANLPKLRLLDFRPFVHDGRQAVLLRDPLQLSDRTIVVPRLLAPLLALCDGTRDNGALRAAAAIRFGLPVAQSTVDHLVEALDEAVLLDNEHYEQEHARALDEYRAAPYRPPSVAGGSYPAEAEELRALLRGHLDEVEADDGSLATSPAGGRGLVSPHIDYARGGPVYARVWQRAAEAVKAADLAVIFGTDHFGATDLTLTRQNYATPFGVLPTACDIVDDLARVVGPEAAFAGELRHRGEHSVELAAVWLHYMRDERPVELVPVLCGSFARYLQDEAGPEDDQALNAVVEVLRRRLDGRRAIVVAAGDLAHVGPAFGGDPLDLAGRARLKRADDELIKHLTAGDAAGFLAAIKRERDRNNVCGTLPIYLTLHVLDPARGELAGYAMCPADGQGASVVSVCGVVLN